MFGGVDLGLRGALGVIDDAGSYVDARLVPITGLASSPDGYDVPGMLTLILGYPDLRFVLIEAPNVVRVPKTVGRKTTMIVSATATQQLALSCGLWIGLLTACGIEYELANARTWQAQALAGMPGRDTKAKSLAYARRFFPECDLTPRPFRTPQDGLSDALTLAAVGRSSRRSIRPSTG